MTNRRKPRNINAKLTEEFNQRLRALGMDKHAELGYVLYVTDAVRGRCRYSVKDITVPSWTLKKDDPGYALYYACHEIAHAFTFEKFGKRNHGPDFVREFMRICPAELWHHELGYKAKSAKAQGISTDVKANIALAQKLFHGQPVPAPIKKAAGPTDDAATMRRKAVERDPRLSKYLTNVSDAELVSYLRGYFQKDNDRSYGPEDNGAVTLTPLERDIIKHRLEVPDAIADAVDSTLEEIGACLNDDEFADCIQYVTDQIEGEFFPQQFGNVEWEILEDCVLGSTYVAAAESDLGFDVSQQKLNAIYRAYESLCKKLGLSA
jgi:hypothetical protein